jgi:uncharacterized protein YjiS (DUF1127 family)
MKRRSFFVFLVALALALLLTGAGGFYWLVASNPLKLLNSGRNETPAAAMFAPRQAPIILSLLVKPEQLAAFRRVVARPGERRRARAELEQLKQSLLANTGLDYEEDIQPWLGEEVTLGVTATDFDRDPSNGQQPGYLLAIATQNPEKSREFLQLFWQKRAITGTDLMFEQFKGVKLIYATEVQERGKEDKGKEKERIELQMLQSKILTPYLATAVVGEQFVLFANHPKVLRDAITNVQAPNLNLSSASFYDQALQTLNQPRIGLAFVNLPQLANWLAQGSTASQKYQKLAQDLALGNTPDTGVTPKYQTLAIALELNQGGLMAETALVPVTEQGISTTAPLSQPVGALRYIPGNSAIAASGNHLDRLWSDLLDGLTGYEAAVQLVNQPILEVKKRWNLDLPEEIFNWVQGEYALAVLPTDVQEQRSRAKAKKQQAAAKGQEFSNDWIFVAQRSEATQPSLEHLDQLASQQGFSAGSLQLGNQTISAWTQLKSGNKQMASTLQAEVRGLHTSVNNYEIFANSITAMDKALHADDNALINSDAFKQATAPFPQPNHGYLYLDWPTSARILERQFPLLRVVELAGQSLFTHLRSLTISSYGTQADVQRSSLFFRLS